MLTFAQFTSLTGDSDKDYAFDVSGLDADLEAVAAVYAVTRQEDDEHVVLYVGQTGDLSDRFKAHHKAKCFADNGGNCLCIHRDGHKKSRLKKETDLVKGYRPTCNGGARDRPSVSEARQPKPQPITGRIGQVLAHA
jgi:predicted GIY-YIG superfamily endonuclease